LLHNEFEGFLAGCEVRFLNAFRAIFRESNPAQAGNQSLRVFVQRRGV
jgi:hypothetical protein